MQPSFRNLKSKVVTEQLIELLDEKISPLRI